MTGEDEQSNIQSLNHTIDSNLLALKLVEYARPKQSHSARQTHFLISQKNVAVIIRISTVLVRVI